MKEIKTLLKKFNSKNYIIIKQSGIKIKYNIFFKLVKKQIIFFKRKKIKPDDLIISYIPNSIENLILFTACGLSGLKFFPLDINTPQKNLEKLINLTKPKIIFIDKKNKTLKLKLFFSIQTNQTFDWLKKIKNCKIKYNNNGKLILFTSGTTGNNKLIQINFIKLIKSTQQFIKFYKFKKLNFLSTFQTSYIGGFFNSFLIPLFSNSNIIFFDFFGGIDIFNFWKHINNYKISAVWFTPSVVKSLLKLDSSNEIKIHISSKIKFPFCGTAYLHKKLKKEFFKIFNIKLLENYGLSETTFVSLEKPNSKNTYKTGFVGSIINNVNVGLKDINRGMHKEIHVNSKYIFDGYIDLNNENNLISYDKFFNTKDVGFIKKEKKEKLLFLSGRSKEIIKRRGYYLNLNLIEEFFEKHPLVIEAKAVSHNDNSGLEDYKLFLKLKNNNNLNLKKVNGWSYKNINPNYLPEKIILIRKFSKTTSGKIKIFSL